jgi:CheY-like chemotaxis protein
MEPSRQVDGGGPRVLVVDDDRDSGETTRMILEDEGYAVDLAPNGKKALERLSGGPLPTLILVDLMMPVMDGAAFLKEIEASAELSTIPVVVMTASGPDPRTSGLRYPLLRKPFGIDELVRIVTERSPRLWDEEEPTDEVSTVTDTGSLRRIAVSDATPRTYCSMCDRRATMRCVGCGEAFCRGCIDAGPDGRCARCWREKHR